MTRKDYVAFANALYEERMLDEDQYNEAGQGTIARIVQRLEAVFAADNPRFDRVRFERAVYRDYEEDTR